MKRILSYIIMLAAVMTASSCKDMVEGLNDNTNNVATTDVDAGLYMNTPEIALADELLGMFSRIVALWTGQLYGVNQTPLIYYNYQVAESTFDFDNYHNVVTQCRFIQDHAPENTLYQGMTRVMEGLLFGTYASVYGDVPCSGVLAGETTPLFDPQKEV